MLNFTSTRILFGVLLITAMLLDWKYNVPFWVYVILIVAFLSILVYGSYFIQSNFFIPALSKGSDQRRAIAITFDDGPNKQYTPDVLNLLKKENAPAAFFLIGKNISGNEELLLRMMAEGHVIGNHSYSHTYWFSLNDSNTMLSDLQQCDNEIQKVIGERPKLFRPPYGVTNPMVRDAVRKGNYDCIGWSIRTYDTNVKSAELLLRKSLKNISHGDIILFHDWGKFTLGILSDFIREVRGRGYQIVRLDELLKVQAYYA